MIDISSIGTFDIIFISIIGISTLFGVVRGFIKSTVSLVGWMIAAVIALNFNFLLVPYIEKYNFSHSVSEVAAVIIAFVIAAIIIAIINSIFLSLIKSLCGGVIDRSAGLTFGFARGCAVACIAFYVLTLILPDLYVTSSTQTTKENEKLPTWAKDSKAIILLSRGSDIISSLLPVNFKRDLKESIVETVDENENQLTFSTTKMDSIKTTNKILTSLPKGVLDNVPENDLILLQDSSVSSHIKVLVLNKIANQYHQYVNQQSSLSDGHDNKSKQVNQQYHSVMQDIEGLIAQYNSMSNNKIVSTKE